LNASCASLFGFEQVLEIEKRWREAEEMGDVMKSLENRTLYFKREMDILAELDEMKSIRVSCFNFRHYFLLLFEYGMLRSPNGIMYV